MSDDANAFLRPSKTKGNSKHIVSANPAGVSNVPIIKDSWLAHTSV